MTPNPLDGISGTRRAPALFLDGPDQNPGRGMSASPPLGTPQYRIESPDYLLRKRLTYNVSRLSRLLDEASVEPSEHLSAYSALRDRPALSGEDSPLARMASPGLPGVSARRDGVSHALRPAY